MSQRPRKDFAQIIKSYYGRKVNIIKEGRDSSGRFTSAPREDKRKQIIGSKFGKLTVVGVEYGIRVNNKSRTMCECVCDCGNKCVVVRDKLVTGRKTSCGCDTSLRKSIANRKDLTGMRFGRLAVIEMLWDCKPTKCVCKCDCGNTAIVTASSMTYGKTQSCGCYQSDMASKSNTKDWTGFISSTGIKMLHRTKHTEKGTWLWCCECFCGNTFECLPGHIMNGHVSSCGCSNMSSGERYVEDCLKELGIKYKSQYSDDKCKYKNNLKFDFAVFDGEDLKLLIEYDGQQHYKPINYWGGVDGYNQTVLRDNIKNDFCSKYNISLLRLPYTLSKDEIKSKIICALNP